MINKKFLNNDKLINEARKLYAKLMVERYIRSVNNAQRRERLDVLIADAYCRYQRRLNRCVLCYHQSVEDCSRDAEEIPDKKCPGFVGFKPSNSKLYS